jgi:hypothetical protein
MIVKTIVTSRRKIAIAAICTIVKKLTYDNREQEQRTESSE